MSTVEGNLNKKSDSVKKLNVSKFRKADWLAVYYPKKPTEEFDLFAVKSKKTNKTNLSVRFLVEASRP